MFYVFIVVENNIVEQVKVFNDYFVGCEHTDNYIKQLDPDIRELPKYRQGEYYNKNNIYVGLYNSK